MKWIIASIASIVWFLALAATGQVLVQNIYVSGGLTFMDGTSSNVAYGMGSSDFASGGASLIVGKRLQMPLG